MRATTINGTFATTHFVALQHLVFPEFDVNHVVDRLDALLFDGPSMYDVILGRDLLQRIGMTLDFELRNIRWMQQSIPMKTTEESRRTGVSFYDDDVDNVIDSHTTEIREAEYEKVDPVEVARKQEHLLATQRQDLERLFRKFDRLFSGALGRYPHRQLRIEVQPDAVPIHTRPYGVPQAHANVFKKELEHLVSLGVLRRCGGTQWGSGTFVIPKKNGTVCLVSDFRALNRVLKRRVYLLPRIQEILTKRTGYQFFSKLDISMQYYTFELDEDSRELTTIVTPFGKFQYCRLPMGVSCAPDMAQEIMEEVLDGIEDVEVYLDDIGAFSPDWEAHLRLLDVTLTRLQDNGFTVNPTKCEWAVKETDWLGYWLTPIGLKPWKKKVEGILAMQPPTNISQLRSFLGAVNYYCDLWPRRSHVLHPLTTLTGKGNWEWTDKHQQAFDEMKALAASDALMRYPDHNIPFHIYTDASDYQIGACIMQRGHPVAYYSRKLTDTQQRYTTMEKELLSIVLTLSEFRTTLLGARLHVYTDHRNLTYTTLTNSRVLRWRLFLEEYGATYTYIKGKNNVLADAFSRLPRMAPPTEGKSAGKRGKHDTVDEASLFISLADDDDLLDCFVNMPATDHCPNPHNMNLVLRHQVADPLINRLLQERPHALPVKWIQGRPIVCYRDGPMDTENQWRVFLPAAMLDNTVQWYHLILGHAGHNRVFQSIRRMFYHPHLNAAVHHLQCHTCQKHKLQGAGYGELPPREAIFMPWEEVHVDLIGPWKVTIGSQTLEFNALTCIDPVTNLVELIRVDNKTSQHIAQQFKNCWLSRYPWPERCVHDNGKEFVGYEFKQLLRNANIQSKRTTSRNPQGNSVCERMHQTVRNVLRTLLHGHHPTATEHNAIVDNALATVMHATRTAVSKSLGGNSPGSLAFRRDMFVNIPLLADLQAIRDNRQLLIDENLRRQNAKRRPFEFRVGRRVLLRAIGDSKLDPKTTGPYTITAIHTNGNVTIRKRPHVTERVNIRRVVPYKE